MTLSVASVLFGHQGQGEVSHAMVLDTFDEDNDTLIFKNTYDDPENGQPKQFKVERTDPSAPDKLYFVHIQIKDMDKLPDRKLTDYSSGGLSNYVNLIDDLKHGWNFFTKKIDDGTEQKWGKFACVSFSCSGCDDWLDASHQNRNVDRS